MSQHETKKEILSVHLLFKTHLDLGFTGLASEVGEQYRDLFIPSALECAAALRAEGEDARFIWTTGSWLIHDYLKNGSPKQKQDMEDAIRRGDISWHGLPFTIHSELLSPALFRHGLNISRKLDTRFGRTTIAAKMTDVPGHSIGIIPYLVEAGIQVLHIGVNAASTAPDVPDRFLWRHPGGGEIIVLYHKDDYGGDLLLGNQLFRFVHTHDNQGPSTAEDVKKAFRRARQEFQCPVMAGDLNDLGKAALLIKDSLPFITQEIGDTWIHGAGTDPLKMARFRSCCRALERGELMDETTKDRLLCIPEHTWGLDEKSALGDYLHYRPAALARLKNTKRFRRFEESWKEQREYLPASSSHGIQPPDLSGYEECSDLKQQTEHYTISFHPENGSVLSLIHNKTHMSLFQSEEEGLGLFRYRNYDYRDYRRFTKQYLKNLWKTWVWSLPDFSKPGIFFSTFFRKGQFHESVQVKLFRKGDSFLIQLLMPELAVRKLGCPASVWIHWDLQDEAMVDVDLYCLDKQANRLPESSWFSFPFHALSADESGSWTLDKMGTPVMARDVVSKGSRSLHAIGTAVSFHFRDLNIDLESPDVALLSMGSPKLLDFDNALPDPMGGVHFNLHNNIWGTNFPMWFDDDMKYRFKIKIKNGEENE